MKLVLVTGGARAGKSRFAQARAQEAGGDGVTFVATARRSDSEMAARIDRHRAERPAAWPTLESPTAVAAAIRRAETAVVLLDCVTTWVANVMDTVRNESLDEAADAVAREIDAVTALLEERSGLLVAVTNEVGWSVHPPTRLGRWYQDLLGGANQRLAAAAEELVCMVAGVPWALKTAAR